MVLYVGMLLPKSISKGIVVVLTGFRDAELQRKIVANGGVMGTSVSSKTSVLVTAGSKGATSQKAQTAQKLGVPVMTKDDFVHRYFRAGMLARLFNNTVEPKPKTCYTTHDNGGRPFKVCANTRRFWVFRATENDDDDPTYSELAVKPSEYKRMFVGKSPHNAMTKYSGGYGPRFDGNSMLFQLPDGSYVNIGGCIKAFKPLNGDVIRHYVSPVGNNDVPYPYAVGDKYTYLLAEDVRIPNAALGNGEDPYDFFYNHDCESKCSGCTDGKRCLLKGTCIPPCRKKTEQRNKVAGVQRLRIRVIHKSLW